MIIRQRNLATYGIPTLAAATIVGAALLTMGGDEPQPPKTNVVVSTKKVTTGNQIDVVFAVDTTGSMGGLLDGAKRTVWSIATHIRKTDPNANLRIGLVAYRDVGDDYVTRPFLLTTDLDAVFTELSTYQASGGGDTPENVDAALDDSLHKMQWRAGAKKLVFLVGDAPPASRGDVPTFDVLAKEAAKKNITINTIRCGTDNNTANTFQQIASLTNGEFSSIVQDGGVQQIATPYDDKMAELSRRIDNNAIIIGDSTTRHRYEAKMAAADAAPAAAKADRAGYYNKPGAKGGGGRNDEDLVGGVANGTMSVDGIEEGSLPDEWKGKDKATLKAEIDRRNAENEATSKEIAELQKKREQFLKDNEKSGDMGFDTKVKATLEKQLAK